jgi:L-ornithine N5-monooxygenase
MVSDVCSVNEIFDPERVDDVYSQDRHVRADGLAVDRGTNYGVVRLELLEEIYSSLYTYRIQYDDERDWPQQILPHRTVTGVQDIENKQGSRIQLSIQNDSGNYHLRKQSQPETLDVDLVVVASGYQRNAHEEMLQSLNHLKSFHGTDGSWKVNRDYSVQFKSGTVASDAGVWLQGCNESTHGLSDTLLSILAVRGGEVVKSIFGTKRQP